MSQKVADIPLHVLLLPLCNETLDIDNIEGRFLLIMVLIMAELSNSGCGIVLLIKATVSCRKGKKQCLDHAQCLSPLPPPNNLFFQILKP